MNSSYEVNSDELYNENDDINQKSTAQDEKLPSHFDEEYTPRYARKIIASSTQC